MTVDRRWWPGTVRRRAVGWARSMPFVRWAPFVVLVFATVAELASPPALQFYRLLAPASALAAATFSVGVTLGIGALACAIAVGLAWMAGQSSDASRLITLVVIALVAVAAAYASRARQQRERSLAQARAVVETVQQVVLRAMPERLEPVDLGVIYQAAAAEASIGGDFYEALATPHGVRVIVGDVRGKGLPAVGVASAALGAFRENAPDAPDLAQLARRLELSMTRYSAQVPGADRTERFATAVLLEVPRDLPLARAVTCGHPPPLLISRGRARLVDMSAPAPPLTLAALGGDDYRIETVPFEDGDCLLLYTDGVSETRDRSGAFYPLEVRARRWSSVVTPAGLLQGLRRDLLEFSRGPLDDDVAVVAMVRRSTAGRPVEPQAGEGRRTG